MTLITSAFTYPAPKKNVIITRHEYDLLRTLYKRICTERLATDANGPAEVLTAIERTDTTLSKLQIMYSGSLNASLN